MEEVSEVISKTMTTNSYIVNNLDETLEYLEDIIEDEKTTDPISVKVLEGISISFTVSIPKIIFHSTSCYDVDQNEIVQFCDAVIEGCKDFTKSEEILKIENKAMCLKKKMFGKGDQP